MATFEQSVDLYCDISLQETQLKFKTNHVVHFLS